jgi:hypothetical protein
LIQHPIHYNSDGVFIQEILFNMDHRNIPPLFKCGFESAHGAVPPFHEPLIPSP